MTMEKDHGPLLKVEDMKKYYPIKGGILGRAIGQVKAVDGVSFEIKEGETLGLVGESGCGKSTIGRQIVGLEKPTAGKIYYDGMDLTAMDANEMEKIRTDIHIVFQDPYSSLNPRKHIYEILAQPMLYHGKSDKASLDKDLEKLLTAIKKDMLSYSYENIVTTSSPLTEIHLSYEYYSYMEESTEYNQLTFRVYDDCVNTMNTLKEIGFYEETDTE